MTIDWGLLIIVVLIQNSKGGGLAAGFTGSNIMGVRKTADFLEKATWTLAGALLLFCLVANLIIPTDKNTVQKSVLQDEVKNAIDPNAAPKIPTAVPAQEEQKNAPAPTKNRKK